MNFFWDIVDTSERERKRWKSKKQHTHKRFCAKIIQRERMFFLYFGPRSESNKLEMPSISSHSSVNTYFSTQLEKPQRQNPKKLKNFLIRNKLIEKII